MVMSVLPGHMYLFELLWTGVANTGSVPQTFYLNRGGAPEDMAQVIRSRQR